MKTFLLAARFLLLTAGTLALVQFANASGSPGGGGGTAQNISTSDTYSQNYITLQGVSNTNTNGDFVLRLTTPSNVPGDGTTAASRLEIDITALAAQGGLPLVPSGVDPVAALNYLSVYSAPSATVGDDLDANGVPISSCILLTTGSSVKATIPYPGPSITIDLLVRMSLPVGAISGGYGYIVKTSGWPTTDAIGDTITTADSGAQINASVVVGTAPTVTISSPSNNQSFTYPASENFSFQATVLPTNTLGWITSLTANLTDSNKNVTPLSFTPGNLNTVTATGSASAQLNPGTYSLNVHAVSNDGGVADSSVAFVVAPAATGSPPSVTIISPVAATPSTTYTISGGSTYGVPISFQCTGLSSTPNDTIIVLLTGASTGTTYTSTVNGTYTNTATPGSVVLNYPVGSMVNINGTVASLSLPADTYTLTVTDADSYGSKTATSTFVVQQVGLPAVSVSSPNTVTIPSGGSTAAISYSVTGSATAGMVDSAITSGSVALYAGLYSLTNLPASGTAALQTVTLTPSSGVISASGNFTPVAAGSYTLVAIDSNKTGSSDTFGTTATATCQVVVQQVATPTVSVTSASPVNVSSGSTGSISYSVTGGISAAGTVGNAITSGTVALYAGSAATGTPLQTVTLTPSAGAISASGTFTYAAPAGTYTILAQDSNGSSASDTYGKTATATCAVVVQVLVPSTPAIAITTPANGYSTTLASGATTAPVGYTITGSATGGTVNTITSASATLYSGSSASGTVVATVAQSAFTGIGTASISATGTFTLAAGTYTLAATDSNGATSANATPVTFTVATSGGGSPSGGLPAGAVEFLTWLSGHCGDQTACGGGYNGCGGYSTLGAYARSGSPICQTVTQNNVTGGTVVPLAFAIYNCSNTRYTGGTTYGTGCDGTFVNDQTVTISVTEIYSNGVSATPVVYGYTASGPNPAAGFWIVKNEYLLNFPTSAGTHHYSIEVDHTNSDGSLTELGTQDLYTTTSCLPNPSSNSCNFNATTIAKGCTVWFNSVVKVTCGTTQTSHLLCDGSTISFTANGSNVTLNVPAGVIQFSPTAKTVTTCYNAAANSWATVVPANSDLMS